MEQEGTAESAQNIAFEYPLQKLSIHAAQLLIYPLLLLLRLTIVRNKLYRTNFKLESSSVNPNLTYILYANHQSILDALIICASLPFKTARPLLPFHFFVENAYFKGPIKGFLNAMGGFPAHYDANRVYGLDRARALMSIGQTIIIFPPGMRTRKHVAKSGISVLATESNTRLIPIHIDWKHRWHCHVHIGIPIKGGTAHSSEQLMRHVYDLPAYYASSTT
jgi:1-acyl-sn-glycerol-3-phosphate acyltransferase